MSYRDTNLENNSILHPFKIVTIFTHRDYKLPTMSSWPDLDYQAYVSSCCVAIGPNRNRLIGYPKTFMPLLTPWGLNIILLKCFSISLAYTFTSSVSGFINLIF